MLNCGNLSIAKREFSFTKMSLCVLADGDLSLGAKLVWCAIYQFCNNEKFRRQFHFSAKSVAGFLGMSEATSKRYISELIEKGYMQRFVSGKTDRGGNAFSYLLSADKFSSKEEAHDIIKEAFERVQQIEFGEMIDRQVDGVTEGFMAQNWQDGKVYTNASKLPVFGESQSESEQKLKFEPINKNIKQTMKNNKLTIINNISKQTNVKVSPQPQRVLYADKGKREFYMVDVAADMVVYEVFGRLGYKDHKERGFWQQIQAFTLALMFSQNKKRLMTEDELKAMVLYQKAELEANYIKSGSKSGLTEARPNIVVEMVRFIDTMMSGKNASLLAEL